MWAPCPAGQPPLGLVGSQVASEFVWSRRTQVFPSESCNQSQRQRGSISSKSMQKIVEAGLQLRTSALAVAGFNYACLPRSQRPRLVCAIQTVQPRRNADTDFPRFNCKAYSAARAIMEWSEIPPPSLQKCNCASHTPCPGAPGDLRLPRLITSFRHSPAVT